MVVKLKVLFIGLGSIGVRHLRNLLVVAADRNIVMQVDALRSNAKPIPPDIEDILSRVFFSAENVSDDYDIVFVTNPTSMHYETIVQTLPKTRHMFIEKPVFDKADYEFMSLPWKSECVYYVACPLRYHSVISYLRDFVKKKKVYSARVLCSSYLPDWRPDTDYRQSYSAKAELGGGVRGDLIHEWDYLQYLFGAPTEVICQYGKYSNLDITSEDTAVYTAQYPDKLVSLHLDYYGRHARREVELFTENDVIIGDIVNKQIRFMKSGETITLPQERDEMQQAEIECFLDMIESKQSNHNDVAAAFNTLRIAMGE